MRKPPCGASVHYATIFSLSSHFAVMSAVLPANRHRLFKNIHCSMHSAVVESPQMQRKKGIAFRRRTLMDTLSAGMPRGFLVKEVESHLLFKSCFSFFGEPSMLLE
jgi:hypothetical protein